MLKVRKGVQELTRPLSGFGLEQIFPLFFDEEFCFRDPSYVHVNPV